jgi:L-lysine exporter family protein LysE/ArgO
MFLSLLQGLLLGVGAAAPIGPVNVEIARRTLRGGFRAGFVLGLGAVTVDVVYAVLVALSIRPVTARGWLVTGLTFAGCALLVYLGIQCLREFVRDREPDLSPQSGPLARGYITGLLMTALNPMTLAFWFTVVPAQAAGVEVPALLAVGVFLATVSWVVFFAGIVGVAAGRARHRVLRLANLAGGVVLLLFAGLAIWRWAA